MDEPSTGGEWEERRRWGYPFIPDVAVKAELPSVMQSIEGEVERLGGLAEHKPTGWGTGLARLLGYNGGESRDVGVCRGCQCPIVETSDRGRIG
jgi:hypothetical protein